MPNNKRHEQRLGQVGDYWLSKRPGSNQYYRTWHDKPARQTRRASLGTDDFQEAQLKLAAWIIEQRELKNEVPASVPFETLSVRYYNEHARNLPSAEQARIALALWSDYFPGATVAEITIERQESFVSALRDAGQSDAYINRILTVGRAALNRAYKRGQIQSVPFVMSLEKPEPRDRHLPIDDVALLLDSIEPDHLFLFAMIVLNTLSRPEAALELTTQQIDFDHRLVQLNRGGRKQTKKRRPTVPMTNTLLPWLRTIRGFHAITFNGKPVESVKTAWRDTRAGGAQSVRDNAAKVARVHRRAGRTQEAWRVIEAATEHAASLLKTTPYDLRHTMATELRKRGVPPWEVSGMLGHRSGGYNTTEIYAKYDPDFMGKAVTAIDSYFVELQRITNRPLILSTPSLRSTCVAGLTIEVAETGGEVVGATGIEPVTPTMSR